MVKTSKKSPKTMSPVAPVSTDLVAYFHDTDTVDTVAMLPIETPVTNATKTNVAPCDIVASISELSQLFIQCNVVPKYTDRTNYVGCGVSSNGFSVNLKKRSYNIYCSDYWFKLVTGCTGLVATEFISNGNSTDKVRPNYIRTTDTNDLVTMLRMVATDNTVTLTK